ncbi:MAG: WbqC family protein, partial [Candidatus Cloacimonetes bacterium]|nr:WbqC family protein [Candidatus Cloacimonadota bacterium]
MSKVAIIQSNYIPWKGYFHIIRQVDHFVFLDNVQYTQRDWRNRNLIKTPSGIIWLTVPNNGTQTMLIEDVLIDNSSLWYKDHLKTLICSYKRCRHFDFFFNFLENIYLGHNWKKQSELNQFLIREISQIMNINTEFHQA